MLVDVAFSADGSNDNSIAATSTLAPVNFRDIEIGAVITRHHTLVSGRRQFQRAQDLRDGEEPTERSECIRQDVGIPTK